MIKLVDVHCHLDDESFANDLDEIIKNARSVGVVKIITSALNFDSLNKSFQIKEKYKENVEITLGLDYTILDENKVNEITDWLIKNKDKIVGIGEVGLDFFIFRSEKQKEIQKRIFKHWINLAINLNLPLVVHSRSAGKYAIKMLIESGITKVVMHAFDGSVGYAIEGAKRGFYFSIPPSVVRSEQKQKLVKHLSLDNILLESDAPVLGPEKNVRNAPSNVIVSVGLISQIKKVPIVEVAERTTQNAIKLFNLNISLP